MHGMNDPPSQFVRGSSQTFFPSFRRIARPAHQIFLSRDAGRATYARSGGNFHKKQYERLRFRRLDRSPRTVRNHNMEMLIITTATTKVTTAAFGTSRNTSYIQHEGAIPLIGLCSLPVRIFHAEPFQLHDPAKVAPQWGYRIMSVTPGWRSGWKSACLLPARNIFFSYMIRMMPLRF